MRRFLPVAALLVVVGCGDAVDLFPVVASSPGSVGVGDQRVLVALVDPQTNTYSGSPDLQVVTTLRDGIGSPLGEYEGRFVWLVPEVRGLYVFNTEIPGPGTFQMTFQVGDSGEIGPVGLVAVDDPPGVGVGDRAPMSETRTGADHDLVDITSDPSPDPRFYEMSVAEAVASGPSVIVFATPVWCTSQACGPMLDQVKALADDYAELNFVHVEVYENIHVDTFEELVVVPAVEEWGLVSEPWVFVTDAGGIITAAFEGAVSDAELVEAFEQVRAQA